MLHLAGFSRTQASGLGFLKHRSRPELWIWDFEFCSLTDRGQTFSGALSKLLNLSEPQYSRNNNKNKVPRKEGFRKYCGSPSPPPLRRPLGHCKNGLSFLQVTFTPPAPSSVPASPHSESKYLALTVMGALPPLPTWQSGSQALACFPQLASSMRMGSACHVDSLASTL